MFAVKTRGPGPRERAKDRIGRDGRENRGKNEGEDAIRRRRENNFLAAYTSMRPRDTFRISFSLYRFTCFSALSRVFSDSFLRVCPPFVPLVARSHLGIPSASEFLPPKTLLPPR